jgi:UPF0271 protein
LQRIAEQVGATVTYLKPHGALYNRIVRDEQQARAVVDTALAHGLPLMTLPGSTAERLMAEGGGMVIREFFADRGYLADGRLVPRSDEGALVTDPVQVGDRVRWLIASGTVVAVDGTPLEVRADSICVHGDSPGAVALARAVRDALGSAVA